jgi:hypothetical protein
MVDVIPAAPSEQKPRSNTNIPMRDRERDVGERRAARQEAAKKLVDEAAKEHEEILAQYAEDHPAGSKPTPTPDEIALAAVGANKMEKEDDGSGPDRGPRYLTREMSAREREMRATERKK